MKRIRPKLNIIILLALFLYVGPNALSRGRSRIDPAHARARMLQSLLELDSSQTESIEQILQQTLEQGELNRKKLGDDYYKLAIENQHSMDSMRARVDQALNETQRMKYHSLQKTASFKYSSRDGEVLARRLLLDTAQTRLVDAILSYAEQDIKKIRQEAASKRRRAASGIGSRGLRGARMRHRAKMLKAHEAIEKILSKAQKKEFQEYQDERMDEFRPTDSDFSRGRRGGI